MSALARRQPNFDITSILAKHDLADTTKYRYGREVDAAMRSGVDLRDATAVANYAASLPSSRKAFLKAAIRLMSHDLIETAKANATPDNVREVQAVIWRSEALQDAIKVEPSKGQKTHTWLNLVEVKTIVARAQSLRDKVVLSLLLGAGLRRDELVNLEWKDIKRQGERMVLAIKGKGAKNRTVPISDKLYKTLLEWQAETGANGRIARSIRKGGQVGKSLSGQAVLDIVRTYGQELDKPELAPHDLRRTYARLGYDNGIDIGQISLSLGHESIATTQRYLGIEIDLNKTVSDCIPL